LCQNASNKQKHFISLLRKRSFFLKKQKKNKKQGSNAANIEKYKKGGFQE